MGSVTELRDAVKDTLDRKGLLKQLQAHMRSQVYRILLDAEVGTVCCTCSCRMLAVAHGCLFQQPYLVVAC